MTSARPWCRCFRAERGFSEAMPSGTDGHAPSQSLAPGVVLPRPDHPEHRALTPRPEQGGSRALSWRWFPQEPLGQCPGGASGWPGGLAAGAWMTVRESPIALPSRQHRAVRRGRQARLRPGDPRPTRMASARRAIPLPGPAPVPGVPRGSWPSTQGRDASTGGEMGHCEPRGSWRDREHGCSGLGAKVQVVGAYVARC